MLGRATTVGQGDSALANPKYACSFLSSEHAPGGPFSTLQATLPPSDPLRRLLVLICSLFQRWLAVLGCHLSRQTFNLARTPRGLDLQTVSPGQPGAQLRNFSQRAAAACVSGPYLSLSVKELLPCFSTGFF